MRRRRGWAAQARGSSAREVGRTQHLSISGRGGRRRKDLNRKMTSERLARGISVARPAASRPPAAFERCRLRSQRGARMVHSVCTPPAATCRMPRRMPLAHASARRGSACSAAHASPLLWRFQSPAPPPRVSLVPTVRRLQKGSSAAGLSSGVCEGPKGSETAQTGAGKPFVSRPSRGGAEAVEGAQHEVGEHDGHEVRQQHVGGGLGREWRGLTSAEGRRCRPPRAWLRRRRPPHPVAGSHPFRAASRPPRSPSAEPRAAKTPDPAAPAGRRHPGR